MITAYSFFPSFTCVCPCNGPLCLLSACILQALAEFSHLCETEAVEMVTSVMTIWPLMYNKLSMVSTSIVHEWIAIYCIVVLLVGASCDLSHLESLIVVLNFFDVSVSCVIRALIMRLCLYRNCSRMNSLQDTHAHTHVHVD